ncbi:MAG: phenylacetate-CoA ligase [Sphingobacteriales bacterium]|jgi:phenylacetate-CoA ligase
MKLIYKFLPVFFQNIIVSLYDFKIKQRRFGKRFDFWFDFYKNLRSLSDAEKQELEIKRLKIFVNKIKKEGGFKELYDLDNINPESLDFLSQFKTLPVINKDFVKQNIKKFEFNKLKHKVIQTSGTTGGGLRLWETKESFREQWGLWWSYWDFHGIKRNEWHGAFGGKIIVPTEKVNPPYWRISKIGKRILFSSFHCKESTVYDYYKKVQDSELRWLHGYPSIIFNFAKLLVKEGLSLDKVLWVSFGAESLLEHYKESIKKAFPKAKLIQHYGLAEGVANISEYSNERFTLDRYFSYVEFVPFGLKNKYKIIGTNLSNPSFPLLRYDTGDIATIIDGEILDIDGRKEDFISLKSGAKVGRFDYILKGLENVMEAQVIQESIFLLKMRLVVNKEYFENKNESELLKNIKEFTNDEIEVEFEYVNEIPRTKTGKIRFVISKLK